MAPRWLSAIAVIAATALRATKALGREVAHTRAANQSNTSASNVSSTPGPVTAHPALLKTSIFIKTNTQQNNMKDVEVQMYITTSEASSTIEQAKAVAELEAMAETETPTQDEQNSDEKVDNEGSNPDDEEKSELVER
ncbi:hypothetical protein CHS0354_009310 [Potamilus streckersoni]|uniref:Secreted protein n=1 Tax=Potamilus streckersoni TaxID=2493646 RepID=A0AAE0SNG6_9BIVA|nr:hypothetical protein CHS0354_009310 [Potamilus streckersoni]